MKNSLALPLCISFLLVGRITPAEDYSKEKRQLESLRVAAPPVIDGKLQDEAWQGAAKAADFRTLGGKALSKSKTEVMTCWDTDKLYIAYICHEPRMELLAANYPGYQGPFSWGAGTDELELFIQPFPDLPAYFHFASSAAGEFYHRFSAAPKTDQQYRWNVQVKTARLKDRWQAELAIPFTELRYLTEGHHYGTTPSDGDRWGITFARFSYAGGEEWSSWNAGTFHRRGPLGQIVFRERQPFPRLRIQSTMARTVGKKLLRLEIASPSEKATKVACQLEVDGASSSSEWALAPRATKEATMPYRITSEGQVLLRLTASVGGKIFKRAAILHRVEGTRRKLEESLALARGHLDELPGNNELQQFIKEAEALVARWKAATDGAAQLTTAQWLGISKDSLQLLERKDELFARAAKLVSHKRLTAFWKNKAPGELEYGVGVEDNMTKLRQEDTFLGQVTDQIEQSLARNEYEGTQVVVVPLTKELKDVRVTATDLVSPEGKRIPAQQVRVRPVGYVEVTPVAGIAGRLRKPGGMWPDPLLKTQAFDCAQGELQPVWIDVFAAADQAPGQYEGTIRILPANSHPLSLSLRVRVWDFELPRQSHLKIDYWFWSGPGSIEQYYKKKFTLKDFERYARFMASYRIPLAPHTSHLWGADLLKIYREPDGAYTIDFSDYDPYLKIAVENGMNVYHLPKPVRRYRGHIVYWDRASGERKSENLGPAEAENIWRALMVQTWQHLKELDWFD